jgi:hypothetical protein
MLRLTFWFLALPTARGNFENAWTMANMILPTVLFPVSFSPAITVRLDISIVDDSIVPTPLMISFMHLPCVCWMALHQFIDFGGIGCCVHYVIIYFGICIVLLCFLGIFRGLNR